MMQKQRPAVAVRERQKPIYVFMDEDFLNEKGEEVSKPLIGVTVGPKDNPERQYYVSLEWNRVWEVKPPLRTQHSLEDQVKSIDLKELQNRNKQIGKPQSKGENMLLEIEGSKLIEITNPEEIIGIANRVSAIQAFCEVVNSETFRELELERGAESLVRMWSARFRSTGALPISERELGELAQVRGRVDSHIRGLIDEHTNMTPKELTEAVRRISVIATNNMNSQFPELK